MFGHVTPGSVSLGDRTEARFLMQGFQTPVLGSPAIAMAVTCRGTMAARLLTVAD